MKLKQLQELDLHGCSDVINDEVLRSIGANLVALCMYEAEPYGENQMRSIITKSQLVAVYAHCSHLEELTIDLQRQIDYSIELLDLVAFTCAHVRHLKINFELGPKRARRQALPQPEITMTTALQIFDYIRLRSKQVSTSLAVLASPAGSMEILVGSFISPDLTRNTFRRLVTEKWTVSSTNTFLMEYPDYNHLDVREPAIVCLEIKAMRRVYLEMGVPKYSLLYPMKSREDSIQNGPAGNPDLVLAFDFVIRQYTQRTGGPS